MSRYIDTPFADKGSHQKNQLEKLEAAKAARLVCLSLLSLAVSSVSIFTDLTGPYLALFSITLHLRTILTD